MMTRTTRRRRAGRRLAAIAAATSLGSALLVTPAFAAPTDGVLKGIVTRGGQGVAGATVALTALPPFEENPSDATYRQEPLAVVKTGAAGAFTIPLTLSDSLLAWARQNSDYVNYTVQVFDTDTSTDERLDALGTQIASLLPKVSATPPDTSGLTAALNSVLDVVRALNVVGCCPEGVDLAALEATVNDTLADLGDLVNGPLVPALVAEIQRQVGTITASIDPLTEFAKAQGIAYRAGDFVYAQVIDESMTDPADDLTSLVLSSPDPVTLELTAVGAARLAEDMATSGNLEDSDCKSIHGPLVTVERRENDYEPVGEGHVMWDTTGKFEYGEHANTDLNGAYQYKGGSWEASVSANKIANKQAMAVKDYATRDAYVMLTQFRYRMERIEFTDDYGDGHVCQTDHRIVPDGWIGGYMFGPDVSSKDSAGKMDAARGKGWATLFRGAGSYEKKTSKGHKYKGGVKAFGVGLYAQSTWSKQVDMKWTFGNGGDHWLYGSTGTIKDSEDVFAW